MFFYLSALSICNYENICILIIHIHKHIVSVSKNYDFLIVNLYIFNDFIYILDTTIYNHLKISCFLQLVFDIFVLLKLPFMVLSFHLVFRSFIHFKVSLCMSQIVKRTTKRKEFKTLIRIYTKFGSFTFYFLNMEV
jgi:hypothetical protein